MCLQHVGEGQEVGGGADTGTKKASKVPEISGQSQ